MLEQTPAVQGEAPGGDGGGGGGPGPCVYLQLSVEGETGGGANGAGASDDDGDGASDDSASPSGGEVRLFPANPADVDAIFAALCEGAALNPDPGAVGAGEEGGDGDGDLFFDREAAAAGAAAARLDALLVEDPSRFEDPPEEEKA